MKTAFRILLTVISLLAMVNFTYADSAETSQERVILEAGEIDSNTVEVGAFSVIIHEQRKGHPVSEEWDNLATVRGYVRAVDAETLILALGRDRRTKRISVDGIQRLVLVGAPSRRVVERANMRTTKQLASEAESFSLEITDKNSMQAQVIVDSAAVTPPAPGPADEDSTQAELGRAVPRLIARPDTVPLREEKWESTTEDRRIAAKLGLGLLGGAAGGAGGFGIGLFLGVTTGIGCTEEDDDREFGGLCVFVPAIYGGLPIGYAVGVAAGVSVLDPHDSFKYSLIGSTVGLGASIGLLSISKYGGTLIFVAPAVLATALSEWSRDPPESRRRLTVSLVPNDSGNLSAVATLRF